MRLSYDVFAQCVSEVRARIDAACARVGRDPGEVTLLPVTKTHGPWAVAHAARHGFAAVGENRVQEAVAKRGQCVAQIRWELIGHLQSNKARIAVETFDRIQSIDSVKLVRHTAKAATSAGRVVPVLLQINTGEDPAKFGADPADAKALVESALEQSSLRVDGLMTIAPLSDNPDTARRAFARLRDIRDRLAQGTGHALPELSMGMSGDIDSAVAEGSTLVRIGTALFGTRPA